MGAAAPQITQVCVASHEPHVSLTSSALFISAWILCIVSTGAETSVAGSTAVRSTSRCPPPTHGTFTITGVLKLLMARCEPTALNSMHTLCVMDSGFQNTIAQCFSGCCACLLCHCEVIAMASLLMRLQPLCGKQTELSHGTSIGPHWCKCLSCKHAGKAQMTCWPQVQTQKLTF